MTEQKTAEVVKCRVAKKGMVIKGGKHYRWQVVKSNFYCF